MRNLNITRQQFLNLPVDVTKVGDIALFIDAGEHGTFVGMNGSDMDLQTKTESLTLHVEVVEMPIDAWLARIDSPVIVHASTECTLARLIGEKPGQFRTIVGSISTSLPTLFLPEVTTCQSVQRPKYLAPRSSHLPLETRTNDMTTIALNVPRARKDEAKALVPGGTASRRLGTSRSVPTSRRSSAWLLR